MSIAQLQQDLIERMRGTFDASRVGVADNPRLDERMRAVVDDARLFYKYAHIPSWPPRLLLNKIVRKLMLPILMPQVEFNEAVRDVLLEMRQRSEQQAALYSEAVRRVTELENQVDTLVMEISAVRSAAVVRRVDSSTSPSLDGQGSVRLSTSAAASAGTSKS